jgi:hypothetical protein
MSSCPSRDRIDLYRKISSTSTQIDRAICIKPLTIFQESTQQAIFEDAGKDRFLAYWVVPCLAIIAVGAVAFVLHKKALKADAINVHKNKAKTKRAVQPKTKEEHRGVIEFTPVGQEQIRRGDERQATRARPNRRVASVFGINNAFTTRDLIVHAKFVNDAKKKMQTAIKVDGKSWKKKEGDWSILRELARSSVDHFLSQSEERLRIVDLVRVVTLKVSLRLLFNASDKSINSKDSIEHLILIGQRINDLWIASKDNIIATPEWNSKSNSDIHAALVAVCETDNPDQADEIDPLRPEANPMNWLLPTYETMWRVVLACILELRFRNAENADIWCKVLDEYISDPSREKFKGPAVTPGVRGLCANDIIKETLRLYPPTRHVYRRFTEDGEDVKADIESCHRSSSFGSDPLRFRPERWPEIRAHLGSEKSDKDIKTIEEEHGFMPFAVFCPAGQGSTQGFGLKMIALLAGVLCRRLGQPAKWGLEDKEAYQDLTKSLPSDRAAFDTLYLIERT